MIKSYFDAEEKQAALYEEQESWIDTPWRHECHVKGAGTDCIGFVYQALINLGCVDPDITKIPEYQRDWHVHNDQELLYEGVKNTPGMVELFTSVDRANGDLMLFHFGKAASHIGIWYEKQIYHAITNMRVSKSPCNEGVWSRHLKYQFRFVGAA